MTGRLKTVIQSTRDPAEAVGLGAADLAFSVVSSLQEQLREVAEESAEEAVVVEEEAEQMPPSSLTLVEEKIRVVRPFSTDSWRPSLSRLT
jgi:hypothetical protein